MVINQNIKYGLISIVLVLPIIILWNNIQLLLHNCIGATDFSIYQQAIYQIAENFDLNPFITIRNVKIFNDHFDPIIFILAPIVRLFNYHPSTLIIAEWATFYGLLVYILFFEKNLSVSKKLILSLVLLFEKGVLTALNYPIHPTTWSIVPLYFLTRSIVLKNEKQTLGWSLLLILFKESFCFPILLLGLTKIFLKKKRLGILLMSIGLLSLIFNFFFRSMLFGELVSYGSDLLKGYFQSPIDSFVTLFKGLGYKELLKLFLPSFFLFGFVLKKERIPWKTWLPIAAIFLPLFGIQFLANKFYFHYSAQLVLPLIVFAIFKLSEDFMFKRWHIVFLLVFILTGMGRYSKNVRSLTKVQKEECLLSEKNQLAIKEMNSKVREDIGNSKTIFTTAGIPPMLIKPNMQVYQAGYYSEKRERFDFLLIQKNQTGNTSPYSPDLIKKLIKKCEDGGVETVIRHDDFFFYAKNPLPVCLRGFYKNWSVHH